jgi:hypothetical protein
MNKKLSIAVLIVFSKLASVRHFNALKNYRSQMMKGARPC